MKDNDMYQFQGRRRANLFAAGSFLLATAGTLVPSGASAHVKWFEAYEVAAKPVPILTTLSLPYFWLGLLLVLGFFLATTLLERRQPGLLALKSLDAATSGLRTHADHFLLSVLAAFFVSLFAVGGT